MSMQKTTEQIQAFLQEYSALCRKHELTFAVYEATDEDDQEFSLLRCLPPEHKLYFHSLYYSHPYYGDCIIRPNLKDYYEEI